MLPKALVRSKLSVIPHTSKCYSLVKAVLFFGTPHLGTPFSRIHATILRISKLFTSATDHVAKQLANNSEYLNGLQSHFALFRQDINTVYFYEEYSTPTPVGATLVSLRQLLSSGFT